MSRSLACLLLCLSFRVALPADGGALPRALPASQGIDPAGVLAFVDALEIRFRNSVGPDEKRPVLVGRKTP